MARKTSNVNEFEESQEVEVAQPVTEPQTNQEVDEAPREQNDEPDVSGDTKVRVTGLAGRYTIDGVEYRKGNVYEVDEATAKKLLSYTNSDGSQPFVQADN